MEVTSSTIEYRDIGTDGKTLSTEQLQSFNREGYVILREFLTEEEVAEIGRVRDEAIEKAREKGGSFREGVAYYDIEPLKSGEETKDMALRKVQEIFLVSERFRKILSTDKMLNMVEDLIGPEIYYHTSKLMCKPSHGGRRKPWHQDFAYWDNMNTNQVTVWIAIDQATRENGCIQVIPGSHRFGLIKHEHKEDFMIDESGVEGANIVYAEMEPGDVLIFNVLTLHASDPNNSPNPRLSAIVDFDSQPKPEGFHMGSETPLRSKL